jgi:DNA replication protein DnaC
VLAVRTDRMLKTLKHARLDHTVEAEMRRLLGVDLLLLDSCGAPRNVRSPPSPSS